MKYIKQIVIVSLSVILLLSSCKDHLDTEFTTGVGTEDLTDLVRQHPEKLRSVVEGQYMFMIQYQSGSSHDSFNFPMVLHATDMMCQDIAMPVSHYFSWDYLHQYRSAPLVRTAYIWNTFYTMIANSNRTLELIEELDDVIRNYDDVLYSSAKAESFALRGMSYLYLIQLYQEVITKDQLNLNAPGVPIYLKSLQTAKDSADYQIMGRNTVADVFEQIESDLSSALDLSNNYERGDDKRAIDKSVIHGLLARYYLLSQQWQNAADHAKLAKEDYPLMEIEALKSGFMNLENTEWIWGYDHSVETQTQLVSWFSHISNNSPGYAGILSPRLIDYNLYHSIPEEDIRKQLFNSEDGLSDEDYERFKQDIETAPKIVEPYASLKFGRMDDWSQHYPYMRAAEMYLIEAEAYAHLNNLEMAKEAIKPLMDNRQPRWDQEQVFLGNGDPKFNDDGEFVYKDIDVTVDIDFIYMQRRIELWGEGFSYFDLKRLYKGIDRDYENTNHSIAGQIVVEAGADNWVFQIPRREIQDNTHIDESEQND